MPLVWDAFFLNDELDLLEHRLTELDDHVSRFVVVEGTRTFTGKPKPLHFDVHRRRFDQWGGRIHHVVAELDADDADAWTRERAQRRQMASRLGELVEPDDLVLIGDVDELPRRELLPWLASELGEPIRLAQHHALWHVNTFLPEPWDDGTFACRPTHFVGHPRVGFQLSLVDDDYDWSTYEEQILQSAGWHVSSLGGAGAVRAKVLAYSHQEFNDDLVVGEPHLEHVIEYGVSLDGRRLLQRVDVELLDPALGRLAARFPSFVETRPEGRRSARLAYAALTWLRATHALPRSAAAWLDRHHGWVVGGPVTPLLLALQGGLMGRRRLRTDPTRWKQSVVIEPPGGLTVSKNAS